MTNQLLASAELARQSYGIACAGSRFGGPRGVWLECRSCDEAQVIVGSADPDWATLTNAELSTVFRRHGWRGRGPNMKQAHCPTCAARAKP